MIDERHIKLAAKLYQARDSYRAIIGEKWRRQLAPLMELILRRAKADGTDALNAGMAISKELQASTGMHDTHGAVLTVLAATVELMEPTPESPPTPRG